MVQQFLTDYWYPNFNFFIVSPFMDTYESVLLYLLAGVMFIVGTKGLASPATALRGNRLSILGMALAVVVTVFQPGVQDYWWLIVPAVLGAAVGIPLAVRIKMTSLPQMVALFNSFVGLSAVMIAFATALAYGIGFGNTNGPTLEIFMGLWIGALTFSGSVLAFAKLQGLVRSGPIMLPMQLWLNMILVLTMFALGGIYAFTGDFATLMVICLLALVVGITIVLPIGGADMPVVISVLNSYSGWAAAATGFTMGNILLIMTGALVGASGAILSYVMCKAMNRSLANVLLGGFGSDGGDAASTVLAGGGDKSIRQAAPEDVAFVMENARHVVVVPGYGMAVAQAQHALREMMDVLDGMDVRVTFAIHPVAGRMPGHMNVLLAEADVPYDHVKEMDDINPEMSAVDAVLVVGANDVVNPDAVKEKGSPLYGMPVLEVWKAQSVFVVKRSMNTGYAGVDNSLFFHEKTSMVFGDAKQVVEKIVRTFKG